MPVCCNYLNGTDTVTLTFNFMLVFSKFAAFDSAPLSHIGSQRRCAGARRHLAHLEPRTASQSLLREEKPSRCFVIQVTSQRKFPRLRLRFEPQPSRCGFKQRTQPLGDAKKHTQRHTRNRNL